MMGDPFPLLRQFQGLCDLRFCTREDATVTDADIMRTVGSTNIVSLRQMHGSTALRVSEPSSRILEADAIATDTTGLTLSIRFADCQSAVIIAPKTRVVCLVHAGWRGVQSKVMTSAYRLLRDEWNIDPQETFVGFGPSLCTECADFTNPQTEVPELTEFIHGRNVDLRTALDHELQSIGVPQDQCERMADCTRCHPETYYTYRGGDREKVQAGSVNCFAVTLRESSKK